MILVTNALQYLRHARVNKIVVINDGRIAEQGTYRGLAQQPDSLFARFLHVIEETGIKNGDSEAEDVSLDGKQDDRRRERSRPSPDDVDSSARLSVATSGSERPTKKIATMTEEARSIGHVGLHVYTAWAKAAGGLWVPFVLVVVFGLVEATNVLAKWYLTYWSSHATTGTQMVYLEMYSLINFVFICFTFLATVSLIWMGMKASQNVSSSLALLGHDFILFSHDVHHYLLFPSQLFAHMLDTMLRAPMSFFDTTPIGRIINRFSKGMSLLNDLSD